MSFVSPTLCLGSSSSTYGDGTFLDDDGSFRACIFFGVYCLIIGFLINNFIFFLFLGEDSPEVEIISSSVSSFFLFIFLELEPTSIFLFFGSLSSLALYASGWSSSDAFP